MHTAVPFASQHRAECDILFSLTPRREDRQDNIRRFYNGCTRQKLDGCGIKIT